MHITINSLNYSISIVDDKLNIDQAVAKALETIEKLKTIDGLPNNKN